MLDFLKIDRTGAWVAALLATSVVLGGPAQAQQVLTATEDGGFACVYPTTTTTCGADGDCDADRFCSRVEGSGVGRCMPADVLYCCTTTASCPTSATDPASITCTAVTGLTGAPGLCLPPFGYCGALDAAQVVRCHTRPNGTPTARFAEGDCDGDRLTNAAETILGTDLCVAPTPVGVFDGSQCSRLDVGCELGTSCVDGGGLCERSADGAGTFCRPDAGTLIPCCATGVAVCPHEQACVTSELGAFCVPPTCEGVTGLDPIDCVKADGVPVPFGQGDCDRDGVTNAEEREAGTNLCGAGNAVDAGVPPIDDAGSSSADAGGERPDAGAAGLDGGDEGPDVIPRFEGGGGFGCRAAPSGPLSLPAIVLALVAIALARRRR